MHQRQSQELNQFKIANLVSNSLVSFPNVFVGNLNQEKFECPKPLKKIQHVPAVFV